MIVDVFAVPPGEDDAFVAAWRDEERAAVLYRALRDDVDFRFVEIGEDDAPDTTDGGCVLIEPFVVPAAEDERFLAAWERRREALDRPARLPRRAAAPPGRRLPLRRRHALVEPADALPREP